MWGKKPHLTLMCTPGAFRITFAMLLHYKQYSGFTVCKLLSDCTDLPFILFWMSSLLNRATELLRLWDTMFTCRTFFFYTVTILLCFSWICICKSSFKHSLHRCLDTDVQYNVAPLSAAVQLLLHNWMR